MTEYDAATVAACAKVAAAAGAADAAHEARYLAAANSAKSTSERDVALEYAVSYGRRGAGVRAISAAIRALPIAPPAPLQVTADKISPEELSAMFGDSMPFPVFDYLFSDDAPKRSTAEVRFALRKLGVLIPLAAPAVDQAELDRLREAATALIADVRARHPGEDLRCPHMIALDAALNREGNAA